MFDGGSGNARSALELAGISLRPTFSTKNPRIFPFSPFSTTLAQITNRSATGALVIQVLLPLITQPSSVCVAVVSIEDGSEPWFGSVKPCDQINK